MSFSPEVVLTVAAWVWAILLHLSLSAWCGSMGLVIAGEVLGAGALIAHVALGGPMDSLPDLAVGPCLGASALAGGLLFATLGALVRLGRAPGPTIAALVFLIVPLGVLGLDLRGALEAQLATAIGDAGTRLESAAIGENADRKKVDAAVYELGRMAQPIQDDRLSWFWSQDLEILALQVRRLALARASTSGLDLPLPSNSPLAPPSAEMLRIRAELEAAAAESRQIHAEVLAFSGAGLRGLGQGLANERQDRSLVLHMIPGLFP